MDKFNDYVSAEYLLESTPDNLRTIYGDARVKTAGLKTGCKIEVTRRVLKRLISPGNWSRLSIVRVTGPNDQSIAQFNRLIETCIPVHSNRREYPRRASLTLLTRPVNHNEHPTGRVSPQSHFQMTSARQNVGTPSIGSSHPNDFLQSWDHRAGSTTRELGTRVPNDNFRPSSVSYHNTPQSVTETVVLSRKTASHSRSESTPKPRPRGIHRRTNDSALLNSPPKDMVAMHRRTPVPHRSKPEYGGISRHLSEKIRNKDQSGSEHTTLNDITSVTTDPAAGIGTLRRSNLRNTSAPNNTKRLHLSRSKIYEIEHRVTQEQSPESPRKPRRPRSLGARHRVQSITDVLPGVKREASHRSKSPLKKEPRETPQMLAPLGSIVGKARPKKPRRNRRSPFMDRLDGHSPGPHEVLDDNDVVKGRSRRTPSSSPKYSEKVKHEQQALSKVIVAVDNVINESIKPSHGNAQIPKSSTKDNKLESKSRANCEDENSVEKLAREKFDGVGEDQKINSLHKVGSPKPYPPVSPIPVEVLDSSLGMVSVVQNKNLDLLVENDFNLRQLVEHEKYATNSVADVLQLDHSSTGSTSMNDTGAPTPLSSISIISNKIKEVPGSSIEKSGNDTIETNVSKQKPAGHVHGAKDERRSKSPTNEEHTGALNTDVSLTQSSATMRSKFKHGTEVLMTLSPVANLSYAKNRTVDFPLGILSSLQPPEYAESSTLTVESGRKVRHLVEHEINVLSEEAMPSPFAAYEVNYSNAEADVVRFDNPAEISLPHFTHLTSTTSLHGKVSNDSVSADVLDNRYCPQIEFCMSKNSVKSPVKLSNGNLSDWQRFTENGYSSEYGSGNDCNANEDPYICAQINNQHEPLPPPPPSPECQLTVQHCLDVPVNQPHLLPPPPECEFLENYDLVKTEECCKNVDDKRSPCAEISSECKRSVGEDVFGSLAPQLLSSHPPDRVEVNDSAFTILMRSTVQDKMNCVTGDAQLSSNKKGVCDSSSSPASLSIKLNSPPSSTPKQVVVQTSLRSGKSAPTSPGHSSLPSSTSSIPLELPALNGADCEQQVRQRQPKQDRRVKSAGASPLHFDISVDISDPRSPPTHGNTSYESSQNCNASTVVSVDLEDMGTQENTHNATEFSNKGRMESPISITLITELQEEGCGTSTMESFCRVAAPLETSNGGVRATALALPAHDDILPEPMCNSSDSSNTTYVSSLKSESFY